MIHMYIQYMSVCVCPRVGVSNITSLLWRDDSPHWKDRTVNSPQIVRHSDPERSPGFTIAYSKKSGIGAQENLQSSPNQIWFGDIMWHHHTRTPGISRGVLQIPMAQVWPWTCSRLGFQWWTAWLPASRSISSADRIERDGCQTSCDEWPIMAHHWVCLKIG